MVYDPGIGRFLEEDPEGFDAGDVNLYRYVKNSPTNYTDPSGDHIYFALDPNAAAGFGHAALIIGPVDKTLAYTARVYDPKTGKVNRTKVQTTFENPEKGKNNWILISVDYDATIFKDNTWLKFLPGEDGVPVQLEVDHYPTLESLLESEKGKRYTVIGAFKTTKEQDHKVLEEVGKRWENSGYRLLWRNCSNLVLDALIIAGVIKNMPVLPGPNQRAEWLGAFKGLKKEEFQWLIMRDGKLVGTDEPAITQAKLDAFAKVIRDDFETVNKSLKQANKQTQNLFSEMLKNDKKR